MATAPAAVSMDTVAPPAAFPILSTANASSSVPDELSAVDKDICEKVALLSIGTEIEARREAIAKDLADAELALKKATQVAPIDWRAELKKIDADTMLVSRAFIIKSIHKLYEKRTLEEQMPKTDEGWRELCYKILNPTQIELFKKCGKFFGYQELFGAIKHAEKAFLTNFSHINWVDPHIASDFSDRFLAGIICAGVGYDHAVIIARQEKHSDDEESFSIYVARTTAQEDNTTANARNVLERRAWMDNPDENRHQTKAYLKQLQVIAYNRSGSGVFHKPDFASVHGKYVSAMWYGGPQGYPDELAFYELPNCLASEVDTIYLPGNVVRNYDLYWPYLVFSCAASKVASIDFLWELVNHENMQQLRENPDKIEGDIIIIVNLQNHVWVRARPVESYVACLSIFPRQTSDIDKDYPPEKLRIVWNMSSMANVATKRATKQYSKKEDKLLKELDGLTSCEYLLGGNRTELDLDDKRDFELIKQEKEEAKKHRTAIAEAASIKPGQEAPKLAQEEQEEVAEEIEDCFPKPNPIMGASTAAGRLWKTVEQELKEKQRSGHSYRTRPDEPAIRVHQYHCNTLVQWSTNNLSTLIPAHRPYYKNDELYFQRESAPIDRACHGIVTVTLDQDYKIRFSSTRAPRPNSALEPTSLFDLTTGLPMEAGNGLTPPKAFAPKRPRPQGKQPSYKAIYTSMERIAVQFPCGTLVFFNLMNRHEMESHAALVARLKKAKAQEEYIAEMTERKVRETLQEAGVAKAEHIGVPAPME